MGSIAKFRKKNMGILAATVMATATYTPSAFAMTVSGLPEGLSSENVSIDTNDGKRMELSINGNKGIANWKNFSIDSGKEVHFQGSGWTVLNRVTSDKVSEIYGSLTGAGTVFLVNPNGITFGRDASVDVGSLVASTLDISDEDFMNGNYKAIDSEGYKAEASQPRYDINMINVPGMIGGYKTVKNTGAVTITVPIVRTPESPVPPATDETPEPPVTPATDETPAAPMTPVVTENPVVPVAPAEPEVATVNPGEKPQMDALTTSNLSGTASITEAQKAQGPSADRVLGLQTAELPFFNEKNGIVKLYGTYDVTVDSDKVQMEATAKVLPEPDQPANQYRELTMRLATANGNLKFLLTYNGTVLDIYPTDKAAEKALVSGDSKKNEEIESKALFEAFNYMGITLDDLDGVYTHFKPLM